MLIGVCGGPCSGKAILADFLVETHGFKKIIISQDCDLAEPECLIFSSHMDALNYVMLEYRWMENYVMFPLNRDMDLSELQKRPFFLLVSVDAPIKSRFKWFQKKYPELNAGYSLDSFIDLNDQVLFNSSRSSLLIPDIKVFNAFQTRKEFYAYLKSLDLVNFERLRPSWESYFIRLCEWSARRSNCMKRRVGCVLVKDNRIVASGYNGTPRGVANCNAGGCPRCNNGTFKCGEALDQCLCLHAEENALLEAGRERIENGGGYCILYCTTCPCIGCAKKIVQAGVKEVIYHQDYGMDSLTADLFARTNIKLRKYQGYLDTL